jgi:hypothetical protein
MTDEVVLELDVGIFRSVATLSVEASFFGLRVRPQLSLLVWPVNMVKLETELFLLLELR